MNGREIHNMDESFTDVSKYFVPSLWGFYQACLREGFDRDQALRLTRDWMTGILTGKKRDDVT